MASQDPVRELLDLVAVHGFYVSVLQHQLGHPIPLPKGTEAPEKGETKIYRSIKLLRHWLAVLDLAVVPLMIRDALKENLPVETAEALMRYFMDKAHHPDTDRDKADFMATFVFRKSKFAKEKAPDSSDRYYFISKTADEFEDYLNRVLGDADLPELKPEHAQLLKEFEFLHQEVDDFRTFDQLMDSGIVQRVRDIKQSLGNSFYHPKVLANIAVYNAMFGARFDALLHVTTEQLKSFAVKVQHEGASIMSRLEDDVTVKHLAEIEVDHIKTQEYGKAQEHFRKISKFKKVVDKNDKSRVRSTGAGAPIPPKSPFSHAPDLKMAGDRGRSTGSGFAAATGARLDSHAESRPSGATSEIEESKVRGQLDAIRTFVRVADKSCFVVPLVKGSVNITSAEAEALRADYGAEKSFRSDFASVVCHIVAVVARLTVETHEFREKQGSSYLWKPHADSITYFLNSASQIYDRANAMIELAEKRGLEDKVNALKATSLKLRTELQKAASLLQSAGSRS